LASLCWPGASQPAGYQHHPSGPCGPGSSEALSE
jgi:hypothetical protein